MYLAVSFVCIYIYTHIYIYTEVPKVGLGHCTDKIDLGCRHISNAMHTSTSTSEFALVGEVSWGQLQFPVGLGRPTGGLDAHFTASPKSDCRKTSSCRNTHKAHPQLWTRNCKAPCMRLDLPLRSYHVHVDRKLVIDRKEDEWMDR